MPSHHPVLLVARVKEVQATGSRAPTADRVVAMGEPQGKEAELVDRTLPPTASRALMVDRAEATMVVRAKELAVAAMEDGAKVSIKRFPLSPS